MVVYCDNFPNDHLSWKCFISIVIDDWNLNEKFMSVIETKFGIFCIPTILSWINYAIWMKNHLVSDSQFCNIVDLQWPKNNLQVMKNNV